ncbi:RNA-binding protein Raly isoform X3 [Seriola aureovittata]|uniref:RNA-binding protein Raly isoform X3 n=1 Tax=Seriola aureovittata TaxID=2871759 RepID=UPI0024BDFCC7|nr:RNA-binding protein Raly isoform X3 [Seriola aureovittata]
MSLKVQTSNVTNKTDPKSINSRVFIGNLNTAVVKKSDVETIFSKYGRVLGCSVHKGYAFVQYASERHARGAVIGENGRVLAGQTLDINMAGEPKPNRAKGLKRSAASLYRLFEYRGRVSPVPRVVPVKRPRVAVPLVRRVKSLPVKLLTRNASVLPTSNCNRQRSVRSTELQAIKSELTQIKTNIEALLGRLEQITEDTHITATELRKAEACKNKEVWQEGKESSSELDEEEEEEQRQNSTAEEEDEDDQEEEEGEHTQDDAHNHMENSRLSSELDSIHP